MKCHSEELGKSFKRPEGFVTTGAMKTQPEFDAARKLHASRILVCAQMLADKDAKPAKRRQVRLMASRVEHQVGAVAAEFNRAARSNHLGYWSVPTGYKVLDNKYTATALAILEVIQIHRIPLDRWMQAQSDFLRKSKVFNLYHCYGPNALDRFQRWDAIHKKKFTRVADQKLTPRHHTIQRIIYRHHRVALTWRAKLEQLGAPSLAAALWYLYPQVSGWYILSYPEFRKEIMESGFCNEAFLCTKWKEMSRKSNLVELCEDALTSAINKYGKLELVCA